MPPDATAMLRGGKNSGHSNKRIDAPVSPAGAPTMAPDLTDMRWIVLKGILFAILAILAGALQIAAEIKTAI